jgi:hypothetical protein
VAVRQGPAQEVKAVVVGHCDAMSKRTQ